MDKKTEMLSINIEQKKYYEVASGGKTHAVNSAGTNAWRLLRARALGAFQDVDFVGALHRRWMGDVSGLKVLDLGVGSGNRLSIELAAKAREYVAIDLSQSRIDTLRKKLDKAGVTGARLYAQDFLGDGFQEGGFDLIYAQAVFHHFKHLDAFLDVVETKLAKGGRVVTYDPVHGWWPVAALRALYRPFQTDAAWEHPFDRSSLRTIESRFDLVDCQGILDKAKWAAAISVLAPAAGKKMAKRWHDDDLATKTRPENIRDCLRVSYHLQRKFP